MACVIIVKNQKSGNEYLYQSVSYRDPITKKPRNKRTYLGRVDPVSSEIIPAQKRGRNNFTKNNQAKSKNIENEKQNSTASFDINKERISSLEIKINQLNDEVIKYKNAFNDILNIASDVLK